MRGWRAGARAVQAGNAANAAAEGFMRMDVAVGCGVVVGVALGMNAAVLVGWPIGRAAAEGPAGFSAIAVSAAPVGANTTQAWFIGKDGSARVCFSTGRSSQCSPVAF